MLNKSISWDFITKPKFRELDSLTMNQIENLKFTENKLLNRKLHLFSLRIEEQLKTEKIQNKIKDLNNKILRQICSDIPTAFWNRKLHCIKLPYIKDFNEINIPTKAHPLQMNKEMIAYCKNKINDLLNKKLIHESKLPWSSTALYVNKNSEIERGTPRLVINYKPLNKVLEWIRYPIPNKRDLLQRNHWKLFIFKI